MSDHETCFRSPTLHQLAISKNLQELQVLVARGHPDFLDTKHGIKIPCEVADSQPLRFPHEITLHILVERCLVGKKRRLPVIALRFQVPEVAGAQETLAEIRGNVFTTSVPDISESLRLLRQFRTLRENSQ